MVLLLPVRHPVCQLSIISQYISDTYILLLVVLQEILSSYIVSVVMYMSTKSKHVVISQFKHKLMMVTKPKYGN